MAGNFDRSLTSQSRLVLWIGFGGLIGLLAFAGFDAVQELSRIQNRTEEVQRDYVQRDRLLHQIRSDLYLSGTYVRDYLLEPEPDQAESHLKNLNRVREQMDAALARYSQILSPAGTVPFLALNRALVDYWQVLDPVFKWSAEQRRERGYVFLRDQVLPRRMEMLNIADQIGNVNERMLSARNERVQELYSQLRTRMLGTIAITLALGFVLAAFSVRRILVLEREAGARYQEIERTQGELKELSARLVQAQENERRAISRELHDEVGQSLSALLVGLSNLMAAIPPSVKGQLQPEVEGIRKLAEGSMGAVRNMALLLRPSMLDDLGLIPALQWQARETSRRTGLMVNVKAIDVPDELPEDHRTCVYRVVQEALHNISRHAGARAVEIEVRKVQEQLRLVVQDDGKGFNPRLERGLGLLGMNERVSHLGGTFEIASEPGGGTRLEIALPLDHGTVVEAQA